MIKTRHHVPNLSALPKLALIAGVAILAVSPLAWLVNSWFDPVYDSSGGWVFLVCLGLVFWSLSSPRRQHFPQDRNLAIGLLLLAAFARAVGQVLAINVIGTLALVIDVYALARWAGLDHRERAVSPFWLAMAFAFSLPVERILQRLIGQALQEISAGGAETVLGLLFDDVSRRGIRLLVDGRDVLVDLPCSGAQGLTLLVTFFLLCQGVFRLSPVKAGLGVLVTLCIAYLGNVARIVVLAVGLAHPEFMPWGVDVMAQPWHDVIGLGVLAGSAWLVVGWFQRFPSRRERSDYPLRPSCSFAPGRVPLGLGGSLVFLLLSIGVVALPHRPVDVSAPLPETVLPAVLLGEAAEAEPLLARERAYFTRFGGVAHKARYGVHGLLTVTTTAPLRHLHEPDECLRGLGFHVVYLGTQFEPYPSAIYRATAPDGTRYRVAVVYRAADGRLSPHVAGAVWQWLGGGGGAWTAIQRISPWDLDDATHRRWDLAISAAFDLSLNTTWSTGNDL